MWRPLASRYSRRRCAAMTMAASLWSARWNHTIPTIGAASRQQFRLASTNSETGATCASTEDAAEAKRRKNEQRRRMSQLVNGATTAAKDASSVQQFLETLQPLLKGDDAAKSAAAVPLAMFLTRCGAHDTASFPHDDGLLVFDQVTKHWNAVAGSKSDEMLQSQVIRLQSEAGNLRDAAARLGQLASDGVLKRRSVTPLLQACARADDVALADHVWQIAVDHQLELTEDEYIPYLHCHRSSTATVDAVLQNFARETASGCFTDKRLPELLEALTAPASVRSGSVHSTARVEETAIDPATGRCAECGAQLQPIEPTREESLALMESVAELLVAKPQRAKFDAFCRCLRDLAAHDAHRSTILLDGANLGYYAVGGHHKHGTAPPRFGMDYALLEDVLRQLRSQGHRPLVFLHARHVESRNVPSEHRATVESWLRKRECIATPAGLYDDHCWIYASLYLDTMYRGPLDPPVMVITKDLLRDHKLLSLRPRPFTRWRDSHRIVFRRSRDHKSGETTTELVMPAPYGIAAQRCIDTANPAAVGFRWHLPVHPGATTADGGDHPVWLCVALGQ